MVSLAPNPFAPPGSGRVAVLVCGTHGRDTAHALRVLLTEPDRFADHPFGGVLEIGREDFVDWSSRQPPDWRWQTRPYTPERLLKNLGIARQVSAVERRDAFGGMTEDHLDGCMALVRSLTG